MTRLATKGKGKTGPRHTFLPQKRKKIKETANTTPRTKKKKIADFIKTRQPIEKKEKKKKKIRPVCDHCQKRRKGKIAELFPDIY